MPKKSKNKGKRGSLKTKGAPSARAEDEYDIQGIILGDSYERHRFRPLTLERPKAMVPLLGTPMINYSIDLLVSAGVKEIFIIVSSHASILGEYLEKTKWFNKRYYPNLKIWIEKANDCNTVGDALRHIQRREVIKSNPFILVNADVVANVSLTKLIEKQRIRYKQNSDNIMTCLFKRVSPQQRTMSLEDDLFVVAGGPKGDEMLLYENDRSQLSFQMSQSLFKYNTTLELYHNLCDAHIDICSPTVLTLFEDNFDYDFIRKEFFQGILNSDVYNYRVHLDVLEQEYATRVVDWRTYHGASRDVMERWTFPLVLDNNSVGPSYLYSRGNVYKERGVRLARRVDIRSNCVLGYKVSVGPRSSLMNAVVGEMTCIGPDCSIRNCHIFGNCRIGANCIIEGAVIADNCVVGDNCRVGRGCILSYGVKLDAGVQLKDFTKLTLLDAAQWEDGSDAWGDANEPNDELSDKMLSDADLGAVGALGAAAASGEDAGTGAKATTFSILDDGTQTGHNEEKSNIGADGAESGQMEEFGLQGMQGMQGQQLGLETKWDRDVVGPQGHGFVYNMDREDESYVPARGNHILLRPRDVPPRGVNVKDWFEEEMGQSDEKDGKDGQNDGQIGFDMDGPLLDLFGAGVSVSDNLEHVGSNGSQSASVSMMSGSGSSANTAGGGGSSDSMDQADEELVMTGRTVFNRTQFARFLRDVREAFNNAENNDTSPDNINVEMTSLRLSHHAEVKDVVACILISLFYRVTSQEEAEEKPAGGKDAKDGKNGKGLNGMIKKWGEFFTRFTKDNRDGEDVIVKRYSINVIEGLETACRWKQSFLKYFTMVMQKLIVIPNLIENGTVIEWYDYRVKHDMDEYIKQFVQGMAKFVELMRSMEDSSSGEYETEEDDEDGDDDEEGESEDLDSSG